MTDITINVVADTASPKIEAVIRALAKKSFRRNIGRACKDLTKKHFMTLPPNRMGWPSQGFYSDCAKGTEWSMTEDGVRISIDNPNAPGAVKYKYNGGQNGRTTITAKGKLLTIPASASFYGKRATDFDNLKFVQFGRGGAKALVVGGGGTGRVNFSTGKSIRVKGAGAKKAGMVAFWLKDSVEQNAMPEIIPSPERYMQVIRETTDRALQQIIQGEGGENN